MNQPKPEDTTVQNRSVQIKPVGMEDSLPDTNNVGIATIHSIKTSLQSEKTTSKSTISDNVKTEPEDAKDCYEKFITKSKNAEVGSMPWLDTESASLLCSLLSGNMSVLEWGCGGSTVYFSRYVRKWRCIEHVPEWGLKVKKFLELETHSDRVSVDVVEPSLPFTAINFGAGPVEDGSYEQFRSYIEYPATLGEKFNLIIDDGRARVSAALSVVRNDLMMAGGLLVVHDWERRHYKPILYGDFELVAEDLKSPRQMAVMKIT